MTEYSGEEVAELIGPDLATKLALDDGPYSDEDLDALTEALGNGAALADDVADGDVAALATLLSPGFLTTHTEFTDFSDFLATSPWTRDTVGDAFSGRTTTADADGDSDGGDPDAGGDPDGGGNQGAGGDSDEPEAARTSAFLTRTTSFRTPGEMVQAAVLYRCRQAIIDD